MTSEHELLVKEGIADIEPLRDLLGETLQTEWQWDVTGANFTQYMKDWPEHLRVPVVEMPESVHTDPGELATVHVLLDFHIAHDYPHGRTIDYSVDSVGVEFHRDPVFSVSELRDSYETDDVDRAFDTPEIVQVY